MKLGVFSAIILFLKISGVFSSFAISPLPSLMTPGAKCDRLCKGESKVCYFNFALEHYHTMGPACKNCANGNLEDCFHPMCIAADGVEKGVMSINRQIPGPLMHVCQDDMIVVDVRNLMGGTSTTIHWHGLHMRDTPHMDGVPFVTQCPIDFSTTFRYAFPATESGTQFYHSHAGHHKVNGIYGALVIRKPLKLEPAANYYDEDLSEHVIVASDWMHLDAEMSMPGLQSSPKGINPDNILINGKGRFDQAGKSTKTPLAVFRVEQGKRYRFRYVNSASHTCPLQLQIEKHRMEIIASDSYPVQPETVDTLINYAGERFDFVLDANQIISDYWIRLEAIGGCSVWNYTQYAVLSYNTDLPTWELANPSKPKPFNNVLPFGMILGHPNTTCYEPDDEFICTADLKALSTNIAALKPIADHTFILAFDNYIANNSQLFESENYRHFMTIGNNLNLIGAINDVSFTFPSFPVLTQPESIRPDTFCPMGVLPKKCKNVEFCPCTQVVKVALNSTVEFVIVDETNVIRRLNHPFHLHGHQMYVTGMGQHPDGYPMTRSLAEKMLQQKTIKSRAFVMPDDNVPPIKDTISVPSRGYIIVRFQATNPGFWLLHCHFEWHMAVGMGMILQVGEVEDMVKPPENFPKCGDYMPAVKV